MNIAELFVKIGVKGADDSKKALGSVKEGLGEVRGMSLEAKAAILGAVYGLEQMMKQSVERGTGLINFAAATGISIEKLGTLENVFRQFGVSAGEVEGSLKDVQLRMADISAGKGASGEFMQFAQQMNVDFKKLQDTPYMLQKFAEYAKQVKPEYLRMLMHSLGFQDNMISAMIRNARQKKPVNFETVTGGDIYTTKQASQLNKANIAWDNLHDKVNKAFGRFFAGHGEKIAADLSKITNQVVRLAEALIKVSDKLKVFEWVGKAFEGWSMILGGFGDTLENVTSNKGGIFSGMMESAKSGLGGLAEAGAGMGEYAREAIFGAGKTAYDVLPKPQKQLTGKELAENQMRQYHARQGQVGANSQTQNNNITINANVDNPKEVADLTQGAISKAYKKTKSQVRGN